MSIRRMKYDYRIYISTDLQKQGRGKGLQKIRVDGGKGLQKIRGEVLVKKIGEGERVCKKLEGREESAYKKIRGEGGKHIQPPTIHHLSLLAKNKNSETQNPIEAPPGFLFFKKND